MRIMILLDARMRDTASSTVLYSSSFSLFRSLRAASVRFQERSAEATDTREHAFLRILSWSLTLLISGDYR